eukprot:g9754.t1
MKNSAGDVVSSISVKIVELNNEGIDAQRGNGFSSGNKQPNRANKTITTSQSDQSASGKKKNRRKRGVKSPEAIVDEVRRKLNFCNVFGVRGFVSLLLVIGIAGFQWAVLVIYSRSLFSPFTNMGRPFVWIFLVMAIIFTLLALWIFSRWKYIAVATLKLYHGQKRFNTRKSTNLAIQLRDMYRDTIGINGKYYLWKLYLYEFVENWIQYYNLRNVFLCTMPIEFTVVVFLVMIIETGGRAIMFGKRLLFSPTITVEDRDLQVITDTFVDLFFMSYPLAIIYLRYKIFLLPQEVLLMILTPSMSLFGKLRFMLTETIAVNIDNLVVASQELRSWKQDCTNSEATPILNKGFYFYFFVLYDL